MWDLPKFGRRQSVHNGFTLVELLIAMGILLILTTLSVAVYSTTASADRIRSSARQVQSAFGGARDRGIKAVKTNKLARRGLRLLVDAADPTTVSSLIYVGSDAPWSDGQVVVGRFDNFPNSPGMSPPMPSGSPDGHADSPEVRVVRGWPKYNAVDNSFMPTGWFNLYQQGLLVDGTRIRIGNSGTWYTVLTYKLANYSGVGPEELVLTSDFQGAVGTPAYGTAVNDNGQPGRSTSAMPVADPYSDDDQDGTDDNSQEIGAPFSDDITDINANGNTPLDYELELKPTVLPGQEPLRLSSGIAIDLFNSRIPRGWYEQLSQPKGSALPPTDQRYDANAGGYVPNFWGAWSVEGTDPSNPANDIYRQYSPRMDVMFSPQGSVAGGGITTIGLLHLRLADTQDIGESRDPADPQAAPMLYSTLFPQTGFVATFSVDITDTSPMDGKADDPVKFARIGGVAGR